MASPPSRAGSPYINRLYEFVNASCKRNALQSATRPKCSYCKFEFYIPYLSNKDVFLWNSFRYVTPIKTKDVISLTVKKYDASEGSQSSFHVASRHQFSLYCHAHVLCMLSSRQPFWHTILCIMWLLSYSSQKQKIKQLKQWITLKNNNICLQYQTIASYESCYTTGKKNGLWPPRAILQTSWKESSRVTGRSFSFPMVALMSLKVVTTEAAVLLGRQ